MLDRAQKHRVHANQAVAMRAFDEHRPAAPGPPQTTRGIRACHGSRARLPGIEHIPVLGVGLFELQLRAGGTCHDHAPPAVPFHDVAIVE